MSAAETRIHNALIQNMPAGYHFDTHMHRTVEIFICLSGAITITVLGAPLAVRAGEYLLVFPNVLHSCDIPQDGPWISGNFSKGGARRSSPPVWRVCARSWQIPRTAAGICWRHT